MAHKAQYSTTEGIQGEPFMDGSIISDGIDKEFDAWQTDDEQLNMSLYL